MRIHIHRDGQQYGPFTPEEIRRYLAEGRLVATDLACREGETAWVPLSEVVEIDGGVAAGPAAVLVASDARAPAPLYHHVAPWKFLLYSLLSMGLYDIYWFYRNWRFVRERDGSRIRPFWRAIFGVFSCGPLCSDVARCVGEENRGWPLLVAGSYFLLNMLWRLPDPYWLVSLLACVPLLVPALRIDRLNRQRGARAEYYARVRIPHVIGCAVGGVVLGFAVLSSLVVLPSTQVVEADRISGADMRFLLENGIVDPDETIHYFYSLGFWNIHGDGNLVTDRHATSYFVDEDTKELVVVKARFDEIRDIRVEPSTGWMEDTHIHVETGPDEGFELYVSAEDRRDRLFIDKLNALWKAHRSSEQAGERSEQPPAPTRR